MIKNKIMKKILIFSTAYLPLIGGAEIAVKEIANRLAGDFEFDLICARLKSDLPKREKIGRVNVYRLGWGGSADKYYLAALGHCFAARLHKKNNYCAAWAIMASFGGFAAMFFKKNNPTVPFLLTLQEGDPPDYIKKRVGIFDGWFAQIFACADYVQAISRFLADWARSMGVKKPIEIVPNGVDFDKLQGTEIDGRKLKKELGIAPEDKVMVTVSRLVKKNGVGDLIEAVALADSQYNLSLKLLILGDGPLRSALELKSEKSRSRILFLGEIAPDRVAEYLAIADVFARPSLSEGLGIAFLEAMAAGLPVVGTRVGGIPDFLIDRETGLFCEVGNPADLAAKIVSLFNNDNLRQKLIINGKKLTEENYGWPGIAERMKVIFEKLLSVIN